MVSDTSLISSIVFFEGLNQGSGKGTCLVDLLDPKTQQLRQYLISDDSIQECNAVHKRWSLWFTGNHVVSDGTLFVWSPVNVVFLLLQALETLEKQGNFCSIDHIVEYMGCGKDFYFILKAVEANMDCLKEVCDSKENAGNCFLKLNNDKLLLWLKSRVDAVSTDLKTRYTSFMSMSETSLDRYSIGVVSEYLSDIWSKRLYEAFGLERTEIDLTEPKYESSDRLPGNIEAEGNPRRKYRAASLREDERAKKKKKDIAGMQKLTSFFGRR